MNKIIKKKHDTIIEGVRLATLSFLKLWVVSAELGIGLSAALVRLMKHNIRQVLYDLLVHSTLGWPWTMLVDTNNTNIDTRLQIFEDLSTNFIIQS